VPILGGRLQVQAPAQMDHEKKVIPWDGQCVFQCRSQLWGEVTAVLGVEEVV